MINDHQKKKKAYNSSEKKIINIFKDIIKEKRAGKNIPGSWNITGIEFCNDDDIDYESTGIQSYKIWVEISEDEYYDDINNRRKNDSDWKEEYIYEPEFQIKYFRKEYKKYEYIRVYVHESWGYGGNDDIIYDFLLSDVLDIKDLRKEKLERIMEG